MQEFTGWEYMLIDVANQFGLDKKLFEPRIQWANENLHRLEELAPQADKPALFMKGVMAIRKVQRGEPTGHVIGFDAVCSGIQIMSALTGCKAGARATGLIDPTVRADAYTQLHRMMQTKLQGKVDVLRDACKQALMTMFYGSKLEPVAIFGEDTPELDAFYQAAYEMAPGAWELLQDLLASWQSYALVHEWKLPDGYDARVKVMKKIEAPDPRARIEIDELNHATFTYEYFINEGSKRGLSNVANVIHSVDAYIMRTMHRRCNYDYPMVIRALNTIESEIAERDKGSIDFDEAQYDDDKVCYYVQQYQRSTVADITILPYLHAVNIHSVPDDLLVKLQCIIETMLVHRPFPIITVHDEFKCSPNHMNHLRRHYINIFAELADSNLLGDLLSQIHGCPTQVYQKLSNDLSADIRLSNYALS
jgi:hypothetical protein